MKWYIDEAARILESKLVDNQKTEENSNSLRKKIAEIYNFYNVIIRDGNPPHVFQPVLNYLESSPVMLYSLVYLDIWSKNYEDSISIDEIENYFGISLLLAAKFHTHKNLFTEDLMSEQSPVKLFTNNIDEINKFEWGFFAETNFVNIYNSRVLPKYVENFLVAFKEEEDKKEEENVIIKIMDVKEKIKNNQQLFEKKILFNGGYFLSQCKKIKFLLAEFNEILGKNYNTPYLEAEELFNKVLNEENGPGRIKAFNFAWGAIRNSMLPRIDINNVREILYGLNLRGDEEKNIADLAIKIYESAQDLRDTEYFNYLSALDEKNPLAHYQKNYKNIELDYLAENLLTDITAVETYEKSSSDLFFQQVRNTLAKIASRKNDPEEEKLGEADASATREQDRSSYLGGSFT